MQRPRTPCVGGIVLDDQGRLLLVLRRNEPARGCWSVPGGRKNVDESDADAVAREVLEETALRVTVGELVATIERDAPDGSVYAIADYRCALASGVASDEVHAGDDAIDAAWFTPAQVRDLTCSPGLVEALEEWQVL